MVWDHRVIARDNTADPGEKVYSVHEVYYRDDGSIWVWTAEPIADVSASTLAELKDALIAMIAAVARPVLVEAGYKSVENKERSARS